jgi:hypothetical protein
MNEEIKKLLEDGEELVAVTNPIHFVLIKRNHAVTPFVIKGYDPRRNEFYKEFFGCVNLEVAKVQLTEAFQVAMINAAKMGA